MLSSRPSRGSLTVPGGCRLTASALERIAAKPERLILGIMSGASATGVDAALLKVRGGGLSLSFTLLHHDTLEYSLKVRDLILRCSEPGGDAASICRLNVLLGELFARAAGHVADGAGIPLRDIDLIGSHGQTLQHLPAPVTLTGIAVRGSLQAGEPAVIAERTGITTIADFRARDLAAGGLGSPIASYADYLLFRHRSRGRLVVSLGSIASLTAIPASADADGVIGFDVGPGTMAIDGLVARATGGREAFDASGRYARQGRVLPDLLARLLETPFLQAQPPRSCGREEFGSPFLESLLGGQPGAQRDDLLATATRFTAEAIASACRRFVMPKNVYEEAVVSGGGVRNSFLMEQLRAALPEITITESGAYGLPAGAKEAVVSAILANETILGSPGNLPSATGALRRVVLGTIVPGWDPA